MIPRLHTRKPCAAPLLHAVLGPQADASVAPARIVAGWPRLVRRVPEEEHQQPSAELWAGLLDAPATEGAAPAPPNSDHRPIWHLSVRLHPEDRTLTPGEWSEIAHRYARAAGLARPGDAHTCRWVAVQTRPGRLDLIASLIRQDGQWVTLPHQLHQRLAQEARRVEDDLGLIPLRATPAITTPGRHRQRSALTPTDGPAPSDASGPDPAPQRLETSPELAALVAEYGLTTDLQQLARRITNLVDEQHGMLAPVRRCVEHTAHQAEGHPDAWLREAGHRLEWAARRLHALQQDLEAATGVLATGASPDSGTPARPGPSATPPPSAPFLRHR
ncbi:hypothetical protein [Streptomyces rimosus]|uniref:hypothetical protein n=1 Tax=Streptomyces rimosus TaxID=1927 RepID=UPI0006B26348|nr:hypothetical protein [Streptomyces rimosus]